MMLTALVGCFGTPKPQAPQNTTSTSPYRVSGAAAIPSVTLTASTTNITSAGTLTLTANLTDFTNVSKVEFYSGTTLIQTVTSAPYLYLLNLTSANNGTKSFTAKVYHSSNVVTTSAAVQVVVNITSTSPSVILQTSASTITTAPTTLNLTTTVQNVVPTKVEFYRDATLLATDVAAPFSESIYINDATYNGKRNFNAKVYNASGLLLTTNTKTVDINIPVVPSITLSADKTNVTAAGAVILTAATANMSVSKVEFYSGTTLINVDTTAPFSASISLTSANNGTINYSAKAYDALGKIINSNSVGVLVNIPQSTNNSVELSADSNNVLSAKTINLSAKITGTTPNKVEFYSGTTLIKTLTAAPYTHAVSLTAANNGTKTFTAKSYFGTTLLVTSNSVQVIVQIDALAPTVSILSSTSTITASTTLNLSANAYDASGISKVEFYRNDVLFTTDTAAPYVASLYTDSALNGTQNFKAKAYDIFGNVSTSSVNVGVNIVTDNIKPTVALSASSANITQASNLTLSATASDNVGVTKVEFYSGTTLIKTLTAAPYIQAISLTSANNGTKSFTAKAYDAVGNVTTSAAVQVVVNIGTSTIQSYDVSIIGLEYAFVEKGSTFELYADGFPENSQYTWTIDGKTFSGDMVQYAYPNDPVSTQITLKAVAPNGYTKTTSQEMTLLPKIDTISPDLSLQGKDDIQFNLGTLPAGFEAQWDFGDGTSGTGSAVSHSYPKLGTYTVQYRIVDHRSVSTSTLRSLAAPEDNLVFEAETWVTRWEPKPKAKFTFKNALGVQNPVGLVKKTLEGTTIKVTPYTLTFDASTTELGSQAAGIKQYTWDFGDGTTTTQTTAAPIEHGFQEGAYLVTLTVEDTKGQKDEYRAYIIAKGDAQFSRVSFNYNQIGTGSTTLLASDLPSVYATTSTERMPYVVYSNGTALESLRITSAANPLMPKTDSNRSMLCGNYTAKLNNDVSTYILNGTAPDTFPCKLVTVISGMPDNPNFVLKSKSSEYTFDFKYTGESTPSQHKVSYSLFNGLRVPKVVISVVPNRFLEGEKASPYLEEQYIESGGKQEMVARVSVREYDILSGQKIKIKIPVYAVDVNGNIVNDATGYFKFKFADSTLNTDCGDCVMVKGKAYATIEVDLLKYEAKTDNTNFLDLSKVKTYANENCGSDNSTWVSQGTGYMFLNHCAEIVTSAEKPKTAGSTYLQNSKKVLQLTERNITEQKRDNTVAFGATPEQRKQMEVATLNMGSEMASLIWGMIPVVGDMTDLLSEAYKTYISGEEADLVLATLAAGSLITDTATIAAAIPSMGTSLAATVTDPIGSLKAGYKLSKATTKVFAESIQQNVQDLLVGKVNMKEVVFGNTGIVRKFGHMTSFVFDPNCGLLGYNCYKNYERIGAQLKNAVGTSSLSIDKLNEALDVAKANGIGAICFLTAAAKYAFTDGFALVDVFMLDFGKTVSLTRSLRSTSTTGSGTGSGNCLKGNRIVRDDAYLKEGTAANGLYGNIGSNEIKKLTPHHIIPIFDNRSRYCIDQAKSINWCQEMRDWFEDVFSEKNGVYDEKFLNSAENGVLLPSNIRTKSELQAFCTKYPNALTHAGSKGVHSPEIYSYMHAKMKKFHDQYQLNLKSSDPNVKNTAKQTFKNDIEVFLKDVGKAFLQDDQADEGVNKEIRDIVASKTDSFSFFCK